MSSSVARRLFTSPATLTRARARGSCMKTTCTGHRIDGYSLLKQTVGTGEAIKSRPFLAGGCKWHLLLYPNGVDADHRDCVSADLKLEYDFGSRLITAALSYETTAKYALSILDAQGNPVHSRNAGDGRLRLFKTFPNHGDADTGIRDFLAAEQLRRLAPTILRNDHLNVLCDITVLQTENKTELYMGF